jgi:hypothetical protein
MTSRRMADPDISDYEFDTDGLLRRQLYCIWKFHGINWRFDGCKSSLLPILMQYSNENKRYIIIALEWIVPYKAVCVNVGL